MTAFSRVCYQEASSKQADTVFAKTGRVQAQSKPVTLREDTPQDYRSFIHDTMHQHGAIATRVFSDYRGAGGSRPHDAGFHASRPLANMSNVHAPRRKLASEYGKRTWMITSGRANDAGEHRRGIITTVITTRLVQGQEQ